MITTIKDVAHVAGVSVATVSRVLNNSTLVSKQTRMVVESVIKELNYKPNFLGRNLRKSSTNVILVLIPTAEHEFYTKIITGMQQTATLLGYELISSISDLSELELIKPLEMLYNRTVDAAVIFSTKLSKEEVDQLARNYNIALCCEGVDGADILTVTVDDRKASFDAVEHLILKGKKKIGIVCSELKVSSSDKRTRGYIEALEKYGIEYREEYVYRTDYTFSSGKDAFDYFASLDEMPDAIFAISDLIATGIVHSALENGIEIGKDLFVMGYDNILISEVYTPSISTVEQPSYEMGRLVTERLIHNINSEIKDNSYYTVPHKIIPRYSTKG